MSLNQRYSEQTVLKALNWLDKQPDNWSEHIKDSNIAVKMYLKSQGKNKERKLAFTKEIKQFLKTEDEEASPFREKILEEKEPLGAFLTKQTASPPANWPSNISFPTQEKEPPILKEEKSLVELLDEKSRQALKTTKSQLNLEQEEEALKLLIQLGRNCLEKLFLT